MVYYIVVNWYECYNIYSTLDAAIKAVQILRKRIDKDDIDDDMLIEFSQEPKVLNEYTPHTNLHYYIFKVFEGEAFGPESFTDGSQNVFIQE